MQECFEAMIEDELEEQINEWEKAKYMKNKVIQMEFKIKHNLFRLFLQNGGTKYCTVCAAEKPM